MTTALSGKRPMTALGDGLYLSGDIYIWRGRVKHPSRGWLSVQRKLGLAADLNRSEARREAKRLASQVADGRLDMPTERRNVRAVTTDVLQRSATQARVTVAQAWDRYMREHYRPNGLKRPDVINAQFVKDAMPRLGNLDILKPDLDGDIQAVVDGKRDDLRQRGYSGQGSLGFYLNLSAFFTWCATEGRSFTGLSKRTNPFQDVIKPVKQGSRKRWFKDAKELGWLLRAIRETGGSFARPYELLLRSCCRYAEIMALDPDEIIFGDPDRGDHLLIRDTKNGTDHVVPLTPQMKALLPTGISGADVVWGLSVATSSSKSKGAIATRIEELAVETGRNAPIEHWTIHDWRRSGASHMDRLGVNDQVIEAVLNHAPQGLRKVYRRYGWFDEKRAALQRWNAFLDQCLAEALA